MVDIIDVEDSRWDQVLKRAGAFDFYHTSCYHKLEKEGTPLLFVVSWDDSFIGLPLILRCIENSNFFDCTSAYGYCGPLTNLKKEEITPRRIEQFQTELSHFFYENKIIAAFSRLHPI